MNRKSPARRRSSSLRAAAAGLVLAVGLGVSAQGPAQASVQAVAKAPTTASTTAVAAPKSVTGTPGNVVTRVADFYGAYIDAKGDYADPDAALAKALRKHYLTPDFAKRLAAWEKKNGADGVLRAQNIPARWTVTDNGSMGHAHEVTVTLTFGSGKTMKKSKLYVLVERYDHVSDIATKSAH
ncbi:hypothetical protein [Streptomyces caniscabiei]|uniref:Secreted protein n=1 Tax=Streptomyces caniscabiei TaxID=2746961 RepID=A0A927L3P4_9ACTN|nr:hypothetical protein [Streptomyces caniscabiei]MBD9701283.1 hypothetical protein [Streptomyces caniscabiei]MBD9724443.1 hypothetical protein [Streptomyces caniscabiei]MDX3507853.1 hypothetical protein [Streptomyces caniscabiei]MDX3717815.1 hypothetical protein [Streptomyces caniscabiei]MDX3726538.1 hypothetical protein [Streptomyces caniscabiei]